MKTALTFQIRKPIVALVFGAGFASSAFALDYSALDLGDGFASGLNSTGQVVGVDVSLNPPFSSFITGPNGAGKTDLPILPDAVLSFPLKTNSDGQVVGFSGTAVDWQSGEGFARAFITGPDGVGITDIGTAGRTDSAALSLNDSGQVVGASFNAFAEDNFPVFQAFITGPGGTGIRDLSTPQPPSPGGPSSWAIDINNSGQAVGIYGFNTEAEIGRAFITDPHGMNARDLGTLGGAESGASAINDAGQVVGVSNPAGTTGIDTAHAFITGPNGQGMTDIGTLGNYSAAADINASGQVIGSWGPNSDSTRAFVTGPDGGGMTDLTSLVRLPDNVILAGALAVNDRGQILALGNNNHSYLLHPGDGSSPDAPLFPNFIEEGGWRFGFDAQPDEMVFVDPLIAVGYDYVVNSGPNFQSALFPSVEGDTDGYNVFGFNAQTNTYDISLGHINPGEVFNFSGGGVSRFALRDIDITAGLNAEDPLAFPTGLTFAGGGSVDMMQSPIGVIPEPKTYALFLAGLGLLGFMARRREQHHLRHGACGY